MFNSTGQIYEPTRESQAKSKDFLAFKLKKIKSPVFILKFHDSNKRLFKSLSTLLQLKALEPSGVILNFHGSKKHDIAALFGLCTKTFNKRIEYLIKKKLVKVDGTRLLIASYKDLYNKFKPNNTKYKNVKIVANEKFEYRLIQTALKLPIEAQTYKVINKIKAYHDVSTLEAIQLRRDYLLSITEGFKYNYDVTAYNIIPPCHVDTTINQQTTANILGCKNQTSGYYWQHRLQALGMLKITNRRVKLATKGRLKVPFYGTPIYYPNTGQTFLQLPNLLEFVG